MDCQHIQHTRVVGSEWGVFCFMRGHLGRVRRAACRFSETDTDTGVLRGPYLRSGAGLGAKGEVRGWLVGWFREVDVRCLPMF